MVIIILIIINHTNTEYRREERKTRPRLAKVLQSFFQSILM